MKKGLYCTYTWIILSVARLYTSVEDPGCLTVYSVFRYLSRYLHSRLYFVESVLPVKWGCKSEGWVHCNCDLTYLNSCSDMNESSGRPRSLTTRENQSLGILCSYPRLITQRTCLSSQRCKHMLGSSASVYYTTERAG